MGFLYQACLKRAAVVIYLEQTKTTCELALAAAATLSDQAMNTVQTNTWFHSLNS